MTRLNNDLNEAAREGNAGAIKTLLLSLDCDPLSSNRSGMTALMWAALAGGFDCTQALIPISDVEAKDCYGRDASTFAARSGYDHVAQLFEAYALAIKELDVLSASTGPGVKSKASQLRV